MCVGKCVGAAMVVGMRNVLGSVGTWVVRRCVTGPELARMSNHTDVLTSMRYEWRHTGRTPGARRSLAVLQERHPDIGVDGLDDLCGVVTILEARGGRTVIERARIVQALLEECGDPELHRALLQTLLPGIVSVCRQLRFGDGIVRDPSETVSMALGFASELLTDWAGQSRTYAAPDLLSALRGRLRRWLMKEKAASLATRANYSDNEPAVESSPLLARLNSFRGSQYERIAGITYARVFEGRSLHDVAAADHSAPSTLQKELQHFAIHYLI